MRLRRAIKDPRGESVLFRRRALAGFGIILLGLLALVGRYAFLQVLHHDDNVPAFRLEVVPEQVPDMKAMLAQIGTVVPLSDDDIEAFKKQLAQSRRFESVPLKLHLSEDDIARFAINRWRFPGVDVVPYLTRRYPFGERFAHLIGYVGRIDDNDLKHLDPVRYKGTTHVGRSGLERSYEDVLHGTPGYELVEVNADGRTQRVLETHPPIPGKNLYLSVDVRIQKAAEDAFAGRPGAAVAIDPRNGQVLAMVSVPSFDPNLFVNGISSADYKALTTDPEKPLYNRALRGVYPPGSTVKPLIGLAGLESGLRTPQDTVVSTGQYCIPGTTFCRRDDQRGGVGRVDLAEAIEQSVNTYFYKLALDLGIDRLSDYMSKFGFGRPTGIDLVGESDGVLPSREWKQAHSRQPWFPGETMIAGIGQGYWAVTPIQLAHAIATFAGHGVPYAPRLVMATQDSVEAKRKPLPNPPLGPSLITSPAYWSAVDQGMQMVMYGDKGTGRSLTVGFPYRLAGKSGTAERFSRKGNTYDDRSNLAYLASRNRAWFEVYAPAEDPQIAVVAVLEAGAWGASSAGPITRHILDAWVAAKGRAAPPYTPYRDDAIGNAPATVEDLPVDATGEVPAEAASAPDDGATP
ncbi:MAG: penicillin-binding protein 2 [Rhodanobacter sp. SCN 68-63]|nr:MAG: penicillin-binding protein 2 [Rhodanobacter sp. SCN 68-63]